MGPRDHAHPRRGLVLVASRRPRLVQWNDIAHSDTWFWVDVRPFEQRLERWIVELDEGEHVIRLSYREIGARIDQLLLTTDVDFVPGSL